MYAIRSYYEERYEVRQLSVVPSDLMYLTRLGAEAGLLFTPGAMVIAQTVLVLPIIAALARQAVEDAFV